MSEDDKERFIQNGFDDVDIEKYNNLYVYCYNNPVNYTDEDGKFGTPIQWVCAVIGGVAGWHFGDYVARQFGFVPKGKGWKNATNYWLIRSGIVVGGAVVGWFTGTAIMKVAYNYLLANPVVMSKMPKGLLWFLGIGTKTFSNAVFQSAAELADHFGRHAKEWGSKFKNSRQYLDAARNLLNTKAGGNIKEFISGGGWLFKYNSSTNEFVLFSNKGTISTFFRPKEGMAYWIKQVNKYKR